MIDSPEQTLDFRRPAKSAEVDGRDETLPPVWTLFLGVYLYPIREPGQRLGANFMRTWSVHVSLDYALIRRTRLVMMD